MKRRIWFSIAVGMLVFTFVRPPAAEASGPMPVTTHASGAALIDVESGRILYSSRGNSRMKIASLTKIMTAIVAIENGDLADTVKVGRNAAGKEGSSLYLKVNEEMSLENLLYGLMLRSGNDAATAIAEHVGGSEEGFVYLMNDKADWLGLANTHFTNPHGLDHKDHYSSANDLAKLTAYALKNNMFKQIVKTRTKMAPNPNEAWDYKWFNKNKMLSMYDGADGVKTGYTKQALRCLVSSATRNGQQLAAVTLNDGDDWADHRRLLDWGFRNYPLEEIASRGQHVAGQEVVIGSTLRYPLAKGERNELTSKLKLFAADSTRYVFGEAGRAEFYLKGDIIAGVPVLVQPGAADSAGAYVRSNEAAEREERMGMDGNPAWNESFVKVLRALFELKSAI
jgi:D-alanyl-D-alanine carboxypeptidase (penicillin-binding protein 5/6)